jgi:hypothetical protein
MGEERKVYKVLVGKPDGKRPLRRLRHRWEDEVRMDVRGIDSGRGGLGSTSDELLWMRLSTFGFLRHGVSY